MRERKFTILSTSVLNEEQIPEMPDSVDIQIIPFIEIVPVPLEIIKTRITQLASEKQNIIFTSAHAVKSVTRILLNKTDWNIYCVGKVTRHAIESWFGRIAIADSARNAKDLSDLIISSHLSRAVFFSGDQRLNILPENLKKANIPLEEIVVYETRLTPRHLTECPDAVLFFSPTAVNSFFSVNTISADVILFALGDTTASMIRQYVPNPVIISAEADKTFVLNMALEYAGKHPIL